MTHLKKKTLFYSYLTALALFFVPMVSSAQDRRCSIEFTNLQNIAEFVVCLVNYLLPLVFAIATVLFMWGVVRFAVGGQEKEENRREGRQYMIWGVLVLFGMLGLYGIIAVLIRTIWV